MDRIWQWAWDRYGSRYSWGIYAIAVLLLVPVYLLPAFVAIAFEKSDRYVEAAASTVVAVMALVYVMALPGVGTIRNVERWAVNSGVDRAEALEATYLWSRGAIVRTVVSNAVCAAVLTVVVAATAGATGSHLIQYGILGTFFGTAVQLVGVHGFVEAALRPVRSALTNEGEIGDSLPRSRPTFAAWTNLSILGVAFLFALLGASLAFVIEPVNNAPVLPVVIAFALTLVVAMPLAMAATFSQSFKPIRDLAAGTVRVTAGDYSQRLPVVQDDDLGALTASFNRMQAGLAERQRLQAAFGAYVDPVLATRLLEQGDDMFRGERREVTVMFVDIRDFTPFAETSTAEDTVARLNALFEIVVPAVVDAGGHVNKFLGDGAMAVFGAPNDLADHADAAVSAAVVIQRVVAERFGGELRIGIGINTGEVIAGTIGGGGHVEFTLIGDTTNVAARVEQLTKTTGDAILLTEQCVDALAARPPGLVDRGSHALKGKSAEVQVFGVDLESQLST
jgi:class 3 adenylate cyclase